MSSRVLVLSDVLAEIEKEIEPYRNGNTETGGILIGASLDGETVLVLGATGPGPRAEHHGAEYALDHLYAQRKLDLYIAKFPDADYIGEWHRHPGVMDYPSGGDWQTAARILQDPAYKVTELINPIVVLPGRQFRIKFYQLRRADIERRRDFAEIPFTEVPPEHPAVRAFFELQERRRLGQQAPAAGIDTSAVQRRLTDEESELRSRRYTVRTTRLGDQFVFEASSTQQSDRKVFVLCPSNYPASAPQVRLEVGGQEVEHDSRILPRWSADHRVVELVAEALAWAGGPAPRSAGRLGGGAPRTRPTPIWRSPLVFGLVLAVVMAWSAGFFMGKLPAGPALAAGNATATVGPAMAAATSLAPSNAPQAPVATPTFTPTATPTRTATATALTPSAMTAVASNAAANSESCLTAKNKIADDTVKFSSTLSTTKPVLQVSELSPIDMEICSGIVNVAPSMYNIFIFSPFKDGPQLKFVGENTLKPFPLQSKEGFTYGQWEGIGGNYTVSILGCDTGNGCSRNGPLRTGYGLLVRLTAQ